MSMTGGLGLGAGSFSTSEDESDQPIWRQLLGGVGSQWQPPGNTPTAPEQLNSDNEFEEDAIGFFGIDENPDLNAGELQRRRPDGLEVSPGRTMLNEITNGARSELDLLSRVIRLEMEDPDALTQLQMEMQLHGLLPKEEGQFIQYGVLDGATKLALKNMTMAKASRPNLSWNKFFDQRKDFADQELNLLLEDEKAAKAAELQDLAQSLNQTMTLNLSSGDAIKQNAQKLAVSLTGSEMDQASLDSFVDGIHARERQNFWGSPEVQQAQAEMASLNEEFLSLQGGSSSDLKSFMNAIETIESGGNPNAVNSLSGARGLFQFMPGTWAQETRRFGLDASDWSPENQRRVAEATMARYYSQFGNWRDVAIAWYAGPASSHIGKLGSTNQQAGGHISIRGYADKALSLMANGGRSAADIAGGAAAAAAGLAGNASVGGAMIPQRNISGIDETQALQDQVFAPSLTVNESENFDVNAYLTNLVKEKGGVDVDAYRYLQTALSFENLLKGV